LPQPGRTGKHDLYMKSRSLPSWRDFGDVGAWCTFSKKPAAVGIARSSELSGPLARAGSQYDMAGGTARPSQLKNHRPSTALLQLGRAGRRYGSVLCGLLPLCARPVYGEPVQCSGVSLPSLSSPPA
jgi:hypothetical protein